MPTRSTSTSPTSSSPRGCSGRRTVAEVALARNRWFTPHTWTNGLGLLANLHVAAGVGGGPFLEFPYDPPGWTPERRDAFLTEPIRPDADGILRVPARPGLGAVARRGGHRQVRGMMRAMSPAPTATLTDWLERAALLQPRHELFIDGAFVPAASGRTFDDITGRDGSRIAQVAEGDAEDVERAVAAARRSFDDGRWADQSPTNRKRVLLKLADLIRANRDELALLESLDVGKPIRDTLSVDVPSRREDVPVVRRDHRQGLRRDRSRPGPTPCRSSPASRSAWSPRSCPGTTR